MGRLIKIQDIDQFSNILKVPDAAISQDILRGVRELDERIELEPAIRQILYDPTETHHGPTEISDILSTKLRLQGEKVFGAFVLKEKSSKKVKSSDIAHQYFKLRQLPDLGLIILMAVGHIQDDAQRDFMQTALDIGCHYLIVDAHDCAKLLLAYEKICPHDGMPYGENGICKHGHYQEPGVVLQMEAREDIKYEIPKLQDVSHAGAKRYSAVLLLDRHYPRDVIRKVIVEATKKVRKSTHYRNERVASFWRNESAHVVWLYVATELQDIQHANWLCRSEYIKPSLDPAMRPTPMVEDEWLGKNTDNPIALVWNEKYQSMKVFYAQHSVDKGEYLALVNPLLKQITVLGDKAISLLEKHLSGVMTDDKILEQLDSLRHDATEIGTKVNNMPFPPGELKEIDLVIHSLWGHLDNLFLYYSSSGFETWPSENRKYLARMSMGDYKQDITRLEYERRKIR